MPSQLRKLALIEEGSPDTVLNFSVVQEGAAEASRQVLSIEAADGGSATIENDRELVTAKRYDITVVGLYTSNSDRNQLETWQDNQTELKWSGIGLKGQQILQGEGPLKFQEDYEDNLSFRFGSPRVATGDYSTTTGKHTAELAYSKNGLALYKWGDADSDNIADGWDASDFNSTTFGSGQQTLETDGVGVDNFFREVYFPFDGEQVTFAVDVDTFNSIDSMAIEIEEYDSTGSLITTSTSAISGTGAQSVTAILSSGSDLAYLRLQVQLDNTTSGTTVSEVISNPRWGSGDSATFTEFYT